MVVKHAIATGLVLTLCVVFFLESLDLPATAARLPQILIIIIAILGILMFVEALKKSKDTGSTEGEERPEKINVKRVVIFVALIALYIFLMDIIGYFILTPLFTFAALVYFKATKVVVAIILSIAFTAFIYGLFSIFLNVPVPRGIFF
ncbi:tripartite tricarboxylate transporter TctB family protein [Cytobacillus gottheilii]|uniref:tripartite tricarboxylate transporter TctB family protein n=1 Tax=Cytobacillus gottheilii TaxID=859144 RepID=UPI002147D33A|nr:tripartite tricarboxylate transporter TctB family protein [Cytobacillus gottheilii]